MSLLITSTISFGNKFKSLIIIIVYIVIMAVGTALFFFVKVNLKRRNAEQEGHTVKVHEDDETTVDEAPKEIQV